MNNYINLLLIIFSINTLASDKECIVTPEDNVTQREGTTIEEARLLRSAGAVETCILGDFVIAWFPVIGEPGSFVKIVVQINSDIKCRMLPTFGGKVGVYVGDNRFPYLISEREIVNAKETKRLAVNMIKLLNAGVCERIEANSCKMEVSFSGKGLGIYIDGSSKPISYEYFRRPRNGEAALKINRLLRFLGKQNICY